MPQKPNTFNPSRRLAIRKLTALTASLPLVSLLLSACTQKSGTSEKGDDNAAPVPAADKPVDVSNDSIAQSLGYVANAAQVDTTKFPNRKGAAGAKQFCRTCIYYTPKDDKWGHCQVIRSGLVSAEGWCNSWSLKGA